jgi:excisionase family DNA binding protein
MKSNGVTKMEIQKMYSLSEVSELLGITKVTLTSWIDTGRLEARKIGQGWRVSETTLQSIMENGLPDAPKRAKEKIDIIAAAQSIFEGSDEDAKGQT